MSRSIITSTVILSLTAATSLSQAMSVNSSGYGASIENSGVAPASISFLLQLTQCEALKEAGLESRLLFPTDSGYELQIETWWSYNSRLRPYCLVLPYNTQEVSTVLTTLVDVDDGAGNWHIAVRSGGHGSPGFSNVANGVTIDLSMMNASTYDADKNVAKIEPGGRWRDVYASLDVLSVTVAGGRDGDVGVGGFLLGGGNSYYSGLVGFGCDTVVNYEVVLGNGSIINANKSTNADLYKTLKGGGSNFGIVTRFDMEAIPAHDILYDLLVLDLAYSGDVIDGVSEFTDQDQSLADNHLIVYYRFEKATSPDIVSSVIHVNTQGQNSTGSAFDKLRDLPSISRTSVVESMAKAANDSQLEGSSQTASTTLTFRNDPQLIRRVVELNTEFVETLKTIIDPDKFQTELFLQPLPTYMAQASIQRGGNMLGLDRLDYNVVMWTGGVEVDADVDVALMAVAQSELLRLTARTKAIAEEMDADVDFIYLNYADASQDALGSYGSENTQMMREVAAKYDAAEVFQRRIPGGFKVSRCDKCKARKTKCDRKTPCASCVTLNVICRTTRQVPEKRQRVLLSSKYDEAIQDVSRQIGDIKEMIQALSLGTDDSQGMNAPSSKLTRHTPPTIIDEQVPSLSGTQEGYKGDSSFQSHARAVENALEATLAPTRLKNIQAAAPPPPQPPGQEVRDLFPGMETLGSSTASNDAPDIYQQRDDFEPGSMPLPPLDIVLKVLRLAKAEKQRFFVDVPIFQEDEFVDICRGVFFATEPVSLWSWICVNVALYYLFSSPDELEYRRMGTTVEAMASHCALLKANTEAAMKSLRLCSEPSIESCRALALLGTFYIKEGHSTVAWRLISGGARAALDLGLHRLPNDVEIPDYTKKCSVFWYLYIWDKGLALSVGRTPVIHHYDVTTDHSPKIAMGIADPDSAPGQLYIAFLDCGILMGEIQQSLFSASAHTTPREARNRQARSYAAKLRNIHQVVKSIQQDQSLWTKNFHPETIVLDIMLYSLLTLVYRTLPPTLPHAHPLQCSDECVDAARMALRTLLAVGETVLPVNLAGWAMMLNLVLSMVPFVSFVVLAGNAIATSSSADLVLLTSVLSVLAPAARDYPTARKMHDACDRFSRIAMLIVSSSPEDYTGGPVHQARCSSSDDITLRDSTVGPGLPEDIVPMSNNFNVPMAQQDWDSVMVEFGSELGTYDPSTLTNIVEPYFTSMGW
ncbi:hypothetical protein F5Y15DRAFT_416639 [Xylariaceae sp. FL0016]|nr:hypothetical protein F5Y15DRAFT_416639 [Xylariaceae sp. FL0016]